MEQEPNKKPINTKFKAFPVIREHPPRPPYWAEMLIIFILGIASTKACDILPYFYSSDANANARNLAVEVRLEPEDLPKALPWPPSGEWLYIGKR